MRIARDFADTLGKLTAVRSKIKRRSTTSRPRSPSARGKPTNLPRGHPLRMICRGPSDDDLRSLMTMVICVGLGIGLPMFDEPNSHPFQVFKRALGLPGKSQMPSSLFDVFPYMFEEIANGLSTATADELKIACEVCRFLASFLDNPEKLGRGTIAVSHTLGG